MKLKLSALCLLVVGLLIFSLFIVGLGSQEDPEGATLEEQLQEQLQIDISRIILKGMSYDDVIRKMRQHPTYVTKEKKRIGKHNIIVPKWTYPMDVTNYKVMFWFVDGRVHDIEASKKL